MKIIIINKNGTVNTIDPDFFVNERKCSATNPTVTTVVIVNNSALFEGG